MSKLFESKQWIGEFFSEDDFDQRFSGRVNYSPTDGVILEYWVSTHKMPAVSSFVHGVLETGEKCTLIGEFTTSHSSISFKDNLRMRIGKVGFSCLIVGDFLRSDELYSNFNFSLSNMQEFFFAKGFKDFVKFSEDPILVADTKFGHIKVANNAKFGPLHTDITKQIYSWDKQALEDLRDAFLKVKEDRPQASFMLKKDIEYRLEINLNESVDYHALFKYITNLADLFAVLTYSPVHPESIQILKHLGEVDGERVRILKFYPSNALSVKTLELSAQHASHFHLPITNRKVDLGLLIEEWMESPDRFATTVSGIQNETGYRNLHSLHGELVLFSTQLEAISMDDRVKSSEKYEYPIRQYSIKKISDGINQVFLKFGVSSIGEGISILRNEIAHVGRPKRLVKVMPMEDLILLSQYLELTILAYILQKIGVGAELVEDYQDKCCP